MAIKIQSNIPMPTRVSGNGLMADLRELLAANEGDSAFFAMPEEDGITLKKWTNRVSSSITNIGSGWASYLKTKESLEEGGPEIEGVRVWKRADVASKS